MAIDKKLTDNQKIAISRLVPKLKNAVKLCKFDAAKVVLAELQQALPKEDNKNLLLQYKNWFFECAIDDNKIEYAISGLQGVIQNTNKNTRIYLEANALLAIAYIRNGKIGESKKYMTIVINKIKNIKSDLRRREFYESFLSRIDDEIILSQLKKSGHDELIADDIHQRAIELAQTKNINEIYEIIAQNIPLTALYLLEQVQTENLRLIPGPDRKLLPEPIDIKKIQESGSKLNSALKKVVWKALCDPENDVYKAWSKGLSVVHDKKYIAAAISSAFIKQEIFYGLIAISVVALAIRFGVNVFCELYDPGVLMERKK